jgi:acetolactate synthase-1/2/3 large subunit
VPDVARARRALLRDAERPVIMAGTNLYWGHGEDALLRAREELGIPVFLNGLARGCVPADHELFFSRARSNGLKGADVALVIGVPMDFRSASGSPSARRPRSSSIDRAEPLRDHPRASPPTCRLDRRHPRRAAVLGGGRELDRRVGRAPARR